MPKAEDKVNFGYEYTESRLEEVKNDSNIIRTHAKWYLSLLAAIALGLASFVFTDLGELRIIYKELDKPDLFLKIFAGSLFISYSLLITFFIPLLLWGVKVPADDKEEGLVVLSKEEETETLKNRVKKYKKRLRLIDGLFKALIISSILSLLVSAVFATYFAYLV